MVTKWRNVRCTGTMPVSLFTFMAILFTSGLDVGLIMFPLVDFEVYRTEELYAFTNPLVIEFGFWGFLVWAFYFLTTFYFCIVEPRLKLFEIPAIRITNNIVIIGTCAFTAYLFLVYLPSYVDGISDVARFGLVALVVLLAAAPITDYHQFYLYWWFAWSIMIGQFVSRFVGGLKAWQLMLALLVVPSIPIAIWFSVLYYYFSTNIEVGDILQLTMVIVGVIFVINSLDSLIRLYTDNLKFTVERFGRLTYVAGNWLAICALVLLYQFTPLKIEWIGLVVVALYAAVYYLEFTRRQQLSIAA